MADQESPREEKAEPKPSATPVEQPSSSDWPMPWVPAHEHQETPSAVVTPPSTPLYPAPQTVPLPSVGQLASPIAPDMPVQPLPHTSAVPPAGQVATPITVNVHLNTPVNVSNSGNAGAPVVIMQQPSGPNFLVRAIWFVCIGSWLAGLTIYFAYAAALTIIGLPLAFYLFNRIPTILTLRPRTQTFVAEAHGGMTVLKAAHVPQLPMWQRALYFIFIGSWVGFIWITVAYALALLIITLPLALMMMNRIGGVMTLHRH